MAFTVISSLSRPLVLRSFLSSPSPTSTVLSLSCHASLCVPPLPASRRKLLSTHRSTVDHPSQALSSFLPSPIYYPRPDPSLRHPLPAEVQVQTIKEKLETPPRTQAFIWDLVPSSSSSSFIFIHPFIHPECILFHCSLFCPITSPTPSIRTGETKAKKEFEVARFPLHQFPNRRISFYIGTCRNH
ncbi:hypothetical protein GALMADRAFT_817682 [Galerina marginata CBS 339.88]|uniref:Uncharacterized protein n=1 Tax=Galerina marginata (strain CBS 339.88) TaxID=685588 RepID=A0A067TGJ7_GALM3|nr:hypothetical protein GALMADRAFT_817682 [Galerina marginata CBS 339.88]